MGENSISGDFEFVDDCSVESDLEMYFPDYYVPGSAERMLLYRELDRIESDEELEAYRQRLIDRFGQVPHQGEELIAVVLLRRYGKRLCSEKIVLKQHSMHLQLVRDTTHPFFASKAFNSLLNFAARFPKRCQFKKVNEIPKIIFYDVPTVGEALKILKAILP